MCSMCLYCCEFNAFYRDCLMENKIEFYLPHTKLGISVQLCLTVVVLDYDSQMEYMENVVCACGRI